jgi:hypothetical protein
MLHRGKFHRSLRTPAIVVLTILAVVTIGAAAGKHRLIAGDSSFGALETAAACEGAAALDFECHQAHLRRLVQTEGVDAAFAELKTDFAAIGLVRAGCHELTHAIGRAAADLSGGIPDAYAAGDPFCSAGYYHGAAEAVIVHLGAATALQNADTICADLGPDESRSIVDRNCAHGVGHGFMHVYANDVPLALAGCDALSDGWERESCYGGVFMENTVAALVDPSQPTTFVDPSRPLFPCDTVADRYRKQCYAKQAAYALYTLDSDFTRAFALCATVTSAFQPSCHEGLGNSAAVHAAKQVIGDANQAHFVHEVCMLAADPSAQASCVTGAVRATVNYYQDESGPLRALCDAFARDLRRACLASAAEKQVWPE